MQQLVGNVAIVTKNCLRLRPPCLQSVLAAQTVVEIEQKMLELYIAILVTPDHNNRSRKYHLGTIKKNYVIQITERSCVMQHKGQRQHNTKKELSFSIQRQMV